MVPIFAHLLFSVTLQFTAIGLEALNEAIDSISGTKSRLRKDKDTSPDKRKNNPAKQEADIGKIENIDTSIA